MLSWRLPKLNPVSLGIRKPTKAPVVVLLALRIDRCTRGRQLVQYAIQIIDLKIEHGRLRDRKIFRRFCKEGNGNVRPLCFPRKGKASVRTADAKILLVPRIKSLRI